MQGGVCAFPVQLDIGLVNKLYLLLWKLNSGWHELSYAFIQIVNFVYV